MARLGRGRRHQESPRPAPLVSTGTTFANAFASLVTAVGSFFKTLQKAPFTSTVTPAGVLNLATTIAIPVADVANPGSWVASGGGSLFDKIDEGTTTNEADYIESPLNPTAAVYETRLRGLIIPPGIDLVLRARRI